ncbi:hypothetical protein BDR26DRAFT_871216 [Obelidium mucronatum]|nr:hypothetical protein BDR26DRAFT_871216 [Obelidium mucronatum]
MTSAIWRHSLTGIYAIAATAAIVWTAYTLAISPSDYMSVFEPVTPLGISFQTPAMPPFPATNISISAFGNSSSLLLSECTFSPKPCVFMSPLQISSIHHNTVSLKLSTYSTTAYADCYPAKAFSAGIDSVEIPLMHCMETRNPSLQMTNYQMGCRGKEDGVRVSSSLVGYDSLSVKNILMAAGVNSLDSPVQLYNRTKKSTRQVGGVVTVQIVYSGKNIVSQKDVSYFYTATFIPNAGPFNLSAKSYPVQTVSTLKILFVQSGSMERQKTTGALIFIGGMMSIYTGSMYLIGLIFSLTLKRNVFPDILTFTKRTNPIGDFPHQFSGQTAFSDNETAHCPPRECLRNTIESTDSELVASGSVQSLLNHLSNRLDSMVEEHQAGRP